MVSIDINNIDDSINRIKMNARDKSILLCERMRANLTSRIRKLRRYENLNHNFLRFSLHFTSPYHVNDIRWP